MTVLGHSLTHVQAAETDLAEALVTERFHVAHCQHGCAGAPDFCGECPFSFSFTVLTAFGSGPEHLGSFIPLLIEAGCNSG